MKKIKKLGLELLVLLQVLNLFQLAFVSRVYAADGQIDGTPAISITLSRTPPSGTTVTATPVSRTMTNGERHNQASYSLSRVGSTNQYILNVLDMTEDANCNAIGSEQDERAFTFTIRVMAGGGELANPITVQSWDNSGNNCNQMSANVTISGTPVNNNGSLVGTLTCRVDGQNVPGTFSSVENFRLVNSSGDTVEELSSNDVSATGAFSIPGIPPGAYTAVGTVVSSEDADNRDGHDCLKYINQAVTISAGQETRLDVVAEGDEVTPGVDNPSRQRACESVGGRWDSGVCTDNLGNVLSCTAEACTAPANEAECNTVGGQWRGTPPSCKAQFQVTNDCQDGALDKDNCEIINIIVILINILSVLAGLAIIFSFIWTGYLYITARDNPQFVAQAKDRIFWTLIALALFIFMYAILNWLVPGGVLP